MSPEAATILVFDARIEDDELIGRLTTYQYDSFETLKWEWKDPKSDHYQAEHCGLFYLQKEVKDDVAIRVEVQHFDQIGDKRYQFTTSKRVPGTLPIALIVVLPCGWTLKEPPPDPLLTRAKAFDGRLACFWRLAGKDFRYESVDFWIKQGKPNVTLVNQRFRQVKTIEGPFAFLRSKGFWVAVGAVAALLTALVGFLDWLTQSSH